MTALDSSSLEFWELVGLWGFIFVWVGVAGEGAEIFTKLLLPKVYRARHRCFDVIGAFFWIVLVVALAVEFIGNVKAMQITDRENARLNSEAGQARKDAGEAIEQAALASLRTASVEATNLVLRAKVVELELKLQPRRITMEQVRKFMFLTEKVEKVPIKILITAEGRDTETFAHDLREMFTYAGFRTNSDVGVFGVNRRPEVVSGMKFGITNELPDVFFVMYDTGGVSIIKGSWRLERTNGLVRPIISETNELAVFIGLSQCFDQIGVRSEWHGDDKMVTPGECLIWVPVK
jgi:hypothetical protein